MLRLIRNPRGYLTLVVKNGLIEKVFTEGRNWIWTNRSLYRVKMGDKVVLPASVDPLLNLEFLNKYAHVARLAQNERGLVIQNGVIKEQILPGFTAYWKGRFATEILVFNLNDLEPPANLKPDYRASLAAAGYLRVFKVEEAEAGLLLMDNKLLKALGPGEYFYWNNQNSMKLLKADLKRQSMELSGQELLSADKAALRMNLLAEWKVVDVEKALLENVNYQKQAYHLLALALRAFVAELSLDELLKSKLRLAAEISAAVAPKMRELGIELMEVGIRDIILPGEMREIMNQVLVAEKRAEANSIMRREETSSTRSLMNTAKLMENNPMLWKLKEMEYLEKVVDKVGEITINGGDLGAKLREIFSSA